MRWNGACWAPYMVKASLPEFLKTESTSIAGLFTVARLGLLGFEVGISMAGRSDEDAFAVLVLKLL